MIEIKKAPNADSRSATPDFSIEDLESSTVSHISDVKRGLQYFADQLTDAGWNHDWSKRAYMEEFFQALKSGDVKNSKWYKMHITKERHHLLSNAPDDVNLIDVLEQLTDCVMAGMTRSGEVYDVDIPDELLQKAYKNTIELLKSQIEVVDE